jgi:site-specific recombinase XerD
MKINTYVEAKSGIVYLTFSHRGTRVYVSTGLYSDDKLKGSDISGPKGRQHRLRQLINDVEDYINMHPKESGADLKRHVKEIVTGCKIDKAPLFGYISQFGSMKLKKNTRLMYEVTAQRVERFDPDATLNSVNSAWLDRFVAAETNRGRMVNGIAIDMRQIRAVFNWCIDNGLTDNYPFRRYHIKTERTRKRNLSIEQIAVIKQHQGSIYADMFLLMLYLCGINCLDLLELRPSDIHDGRLHYRRSKTGYLFDIKLEPEALAIINRHKGRNHLLDVLDTHSGVYKTVLRNFNRQLNSWVPGISTYWARHTFASVASELDIPVDIIGKMLGHVDISHSVTNIYINFDHKKLDAANRKVIDYFNTI